VTIANTDIQTFHYTKIENRIRQFAKDKSQAKAQWKLFKKLTESTF
jgi:hypothetical protein